MMVEITISSSPGPLAWVTAIGALVAAGGAIWAVIAGSRSARAAGTAADAARTLAEIETDRWRDETSSL